MSTLPTKPEGSQRPFRMIKGVSTIADLAGSTSQLNLVSVEFNIDAGSGTTVDDIMAAPNAAVTIKSAYVLYTEATDTAGAEGANISLGTTLGGVDIVAAVALTASKAIGSKQDLTIVSGAIAADELIAARLTGIATTEAGKFKVVVELG